MRLAITVLCVSTFFVVCSDLYSQENRRGNSSLASARRAIRSVCGRIIKVENLDGFLWKPESDHTEEPRLGRPLVLFTEEKPDESYSSLEVYARNGEVITEFGIYEYEGEYGARYYSGLGDDKYYASQLAARARAVGRRKRVFVRFREDSCVGPINPEERNES